MKEGAEQKLEQELEEEGDMRAANHRSLRDFQTTEYALRMKRRSGVKSLRVKLGACGAALLVAGVALVVSPVPQSLVAQKQYKTVIGCGTATAGVFSLWYCWIIA